MAAVPGLIVSELFLFCSQPWTVFCKSGVLLFLHHRDTVLGHRITFDLQNALSCNCVRCSKNVQHRIPLSMYIWEMCTTSLPIQKTTKMKIHIRRVQLKKLFEEHAFNANVIINPSCKKTGDLPKLINCCCLVVVFPSSLILWYTRSKTQEIYNSVKIKCM